MAVERFLSEHATKSEGGSEFPQTEIRAALEDLRNGYTEKAEQLLNGLSSIRRPSSSDQAIQKALIRLASSEGFVAVGVIPKNQWGEELRARIDFAEKALSSHGISSSVAENKKDLGETGGV
jgi:hypothetical protein